MTGTVICRYTNHDNDKLPPFCTKVSLIFWCNFFFNFSATGGDRSSSSLPIAAVASHSSIFKQTNAAVASVSPLYQDSDFEIASPSDSKAESVALAGSAPTVSPVHLSNPSK